MIRYNPQQGDLLDHVILNDKVLVLVEAGPGCGKSFMSRQIVSELTPRTGIYTAFNKAIVEEGRDKFLGTPVECKTFHALAYQYVKPQKPIEPFTYKSITEKIAYSEKRKIIEALDNFFVSSSTCIDEYFTKRFKGHPKASYMVDLASDYVQSMAEGKISPTFNFLLKSLHLMLVEKTVNIKVDVIILDEINDVTAVFLEIFKLVDSPKKIGLGDSNQAIYQFLNLVNGFEELADVATIMKLTHSYRCSEKIAKRIEKTFKKEFSEDFEFEGTDKPVTNGLTLYCTLTNASIVDKINDRIAQRKGFTLLRKPSEIFAAPLAVLSASKGKRPFQKSYEYLIDLYDEFKKQSKYKNYFKFLSNELDDEEINNAVKLLMKLQSQGINLFDLYNKAKEAPVDKTYTISTTFTAKGLEFENVYIADDLNAIFEKAVNGELEDEEKAITAKRCMFVAASRAGLNLYDCYF